MILEQNALRKYDKHGVSYIYSLVSCESDFHVGPRERYVKKNSAKKAKTNFCLECYLKVKDSPNEIKSFEEYEKLAKEKKFILLSHREDIKTTFVKVKWACEKGHDWFQSYWNVKKCKGCPICYKGKKKTINDYESIALKKGILFVKELGKKKEKRLILWKCDCGKFFKRIFPNMVSGLGKCKECCHNLRSGENNHFYNPNLTDEQREDKRFHDSDYEKWRQHIRDKFSYKCIKCGSNKKPTAHHIFNWNDWPLFRRDVDNGVILCRDCHEEFHRQFGKRNNNQFQLKHFISENRSDFVKFGVIGLNFGLRYISHLNTFKDCLVSHICSKSNTKLKALQYPFNNFDIYNDYRDICFDKNIDVLICATPPNLHYEICKFALEHGKHVILEKPATFRPEECLELKKISERNNLMCWVNYSYLWHPKYMELKKNIDTQWKSEFYSVGLGIGPERNYSVLLDWVSHDLSLIHSLLPSESILEKIKIEPYNFDGKNGNFLINLGFYNGNKAKILCGNKWYEKIRSFYIRNGQSEFGFLHKFKLNLLPIMLRDFVNSLKLKNISNNLQLASIVTQSASNIELLLNEHTLLRS